MSTLHTLSALPGSEACADCLRLLDEGDALLLLGDGVHTIQAVANLAGIELYLLSPDAVARGLTDRPENIAGLDMAGFVALTERFVRQVAWY